MNNRHFNTILTICQHSFVKYSLIQWGNTKISIIICHAHISITDLKSTIKSDKNKCCFYPQISLNKHYISGQSIQWAGVEQSLSSSFKTPITLWLFLWYMELPTAAAVMLSSKSKYCKDQVKTLNGYLLS